MYLALTAMTPGISYNVPLVDFSETTNITHGNLSVLFYNRLLTNWQYLLDMNDEFVDGVKVSGILYREVPTYEEAQALFEAGTLFDSIKTPEPPSDELMIPGDRLTMVDENGDEILDDLSTTLEVRSEENSEFTPPLMQSHYMPVVDNSEITPRVEVSEGKVVLTEEVLNSLSMDDLRAHGKLWGQKSRSRSALIEEILTAQRGV